MGIILFPISYVKSLGIEHARCFNFGRFICAREGTSNTLLSNSRNYRTNLP